MPPYDSFRCPWCSGLLTEAAGAPACAACGRSFPVAYGVPDFTAGLDYYWGEVARSVLQDLLAAPEPVEDTLRRWLETAESGLAGYLNQYALDVTRAGWKFLTALPPGGAALDFGCGWGGLALSLAENLGTVYAADVVPERVAVTVRRARERGFDHVRGCACSGHPRLPFPDAALDLVVVNGVLEWLPESIPGRPEVVQQAFLREVRRVLRPQGQLYLGIENRFGFFYWLGRLEEHTKLQFVSLLPRPLAAVYHRLVKRQPYRAYTHSRGRLSRMLAAAGFAASRFYWPYPDYREFRRIVDADDRRWLAESFAPVSRRGRLAHRLYRRMPVLRHIIPSFAVIAGAHPVPPSYLDRLKAALVARGDLQADAAVASYRVTGTGTVQVVLRDREAWFLTLPLDRNGLMRIARDVRMRRRFAYLPLPPPQAGQINHLRAGEFQDLMYKLESFCTGTRRPDAPPEQSESFYLACVRWLVEFQQSGAVTVPLPLTEDQLPGVEESRRLVLETLSPAARVRWEALTAQLAAAPRRAAPLHGDFHRGNVLLDPTGAVVRVVDWDLAVSVGPPVWDLMRLRGHDLFESAGLPWCEAYRQGVRALVDIPAPSVASHVVALGLTRADLWYGALTYPLFQLRNKMRYGDKRAQVILAGLGPVLEDVVRQAEAERQAGEMR